MWTAANTGICITQEGAGELQDQGVVSSPSMAQAGEAKVWNLT